MGDKRKDANEGDGEEETQTTDEKIDEEDQDDPKAKILVMRDASSRVHRERGSMLMGRA